LGWGLPKDASAEKDYQAIEIIGWGGKLGEIKSNWGRNWEKPFVGENGGVESKNQGGSGAPASVCKENRTGGAKSYKKSAHGLKRHQHHHYQTEKKKPPKKKTHPQNQKATKKEANKTKNSNEVWGSWDLVLYKGGDQELSKGESENQHPQGSLGSKPPNKIHYDGGTRG